MDFIRAFFLPFVEIITIIGFIALVATPIYLFLEKTTMGSRFKDMTPWMGWTGNYEEPEYTNFTIHPSNYR